MPSPIVQKLQEEINVLEHELNSELPKELKRARALGDPPSRGNGEEHWSTGAGPWPRGCLPGR